LLVAAMTLDLWQGIVSGREFGPVRRVSRTVTAGFTDSRDRRVVLDTRRQVPQRGDSMEQIRLGQTELQVSRIAFGTWAYGGDWGAADVDEAKASIHRALELGINLFDTAQGYGFGAAERLLGEALWERARREDVVIATKGGLRMEGDRVLRDAGARWLRQGVESSLRSLGTDYFDIYQVHWPDLHTPPEETAGALEDLVGQGKVRHAGVSNYDVGQMQALRAAGRLETLQPPYHLFRREIEEQILPWCARHDIGVLVYGPLAHGLLSGRMRPSMAFDPDDWRSKGPDFTGETFRRNLAVVERLKDVADRRGVSLPQLAVAWTLANPAAHVAIVGARRPSQLEGTALAADIELSAADLQEIDAILADAVPVWGPHPEGM
jgi:aryl-alcohol dehydrogenase-like predicted oxidoreductase